MQTVEKYLFLIKGQAEGLKTQLQQRKPLFTENAVSLTFCSCQLCQKNSVFCGQHPATTDCLETLKFSITIFKTP